MIDVVVAQGTLPGAPVSCNRTPGAWRPAFSSVLALLAVCAWVLKRHGCRARAAGSMHVETALSLGERRSLVIVTVEGRRLLLGTAPQLRVARDGAGSGVLRQGAVDGSGHTEKTS